MQEGDTMNRTMAEIEVEARNGTRNRTESLPMATLRRIAAEALAESDRPLEARLGREFLRSAANGGSTAR